MRKLLIIVALIVLLPAIALAVMLASGAMSLSSVKMLLNVAIGSAGQPPDAATIQRRYQLPPGFSISVYAADVPGARFMRVTTSGDLLLSRPHKGDILLLRRDRDGDGKTDGVETVLSQLRRPLGLDLHDGWLYVAESNVIGRIAFDESSGKTSGDYQAVVEGFSDDGNHWSKTLKIGPDQQLYLAQGSTCNICEEDDARRATIMRFQLDGSEGEVIATGLRNSVGFDWAPWDQALYATDNGRDLLGDDYPPCELNLIEPGSFYGWPYFNADNQPDPDMGPDPKAAQRSPTAPAHDFRAHNAPLGIHFIDGTGWPAGYQRSALVALHGSWNRSSPDGYKVVSLHWTDQGIEERDFLSGLEQDGDIIGRPVDVVQGAQGEVYVSDDYAGAIYRIHYAGGDGAVQALGSLASAVSAEAQADVAEAMAWLASANMAELAEQGRRLYAEHDCASCHERGENPARLDDLYKRMSYAGVFKALREPQAPMPVYTLTERQMQALGVFLLESRP